MYRFALFFLILFSLTSEAALSGNCLSKKEAEFCEKDGPFVSFEVKKPHQPKETLYGILVENKIQNADFYQVYVFKNKSYTLIPKGSLKTFKLKQSKEAESEAHKMLTETLEDLDEAVKKLIAKESKTYVPWDMSRHRLTDDPWWAGTNYSDEPYAQEFEGPSASRS